MKIIARCAVQLNGHIYSRGEACEYTGPLTERIVQNFAAADGSVLAAEAARSDTRNGGAGEPGKGGAGEPGNDGAGEPGKGGDDAKRDTGEIVSRTVATLKRDGICRQLDELGVTYPAKSETKWLAKLLLATKGEIEIDAGARA